MPTARQSAHSRTSGHAREQLVTLIAKTVALESVEAAELQVKDRNRGLSRHGEQVLDASDRVVFGKRAGDELEKLLARVDGREDCVENLEALGLGGSHVVGCHAGERTSEPKIKCAFDLEIVAAG
jgi:hypothetical protein